MKKNIISFAAILFDLDGTLVDSTSSVERSWISWAADHCLNAEEIIKIAHGRLTAEVVRLVAPDLDAEVEARKIEENEAQDTEGVVALPGAKELLAVLPINRWAVVTSGGQKLATARMKLVGLPFPQILVTADQTIHGKPHPEGYLKAAELLKILPFKCLVIEDTPPGIKAAKEAGMKVIAVSTTHKTDQLSRADLVVRDLTEVKIDSNGDDYFTASVV